jgi:cilia- and flagella-associated protein 52
MIDGSLEGEVNTIAMTKSGEYFISAGEDKEIKIWEYDTAECKWHGFGHSNTINRLQISPNQEFIVSVGNDGSIFFFDTPMEIRLAKVDQNKP